MAQDPQRRAREAWRRPPPYRVRGRATRTTTDMIAWARTPPYLLWPAKWLLVAAGLAFLWTLRAWEWTLGLVYGSDDGEVAGTDAFRPRQFPGAK